jgi:hypothetical protein
MMMQEINNNDKINKFLAMALKQEPSDENEI